MFSNINFINIYFIYRVIQILNRQNFETVTSSLFTLSVHILNDTEFDINKDSRDIRINLINILDNDPYLTYEGPCLVWVIIYFFIMNFNVT